MPGCWASAGAIRIRIRMCIGSGEAQVWGARLAMQCIYGSTMGAVCVLLEKHRIIQNPESAQVYQRCMSLTP